MYNPKDIQFAGKHDYAKHDAPTYGKTFSVGVFQWELSNNGKRLKKGKAKVRVTGLVSNPKAVFDACDGIIYALDSNTWDGRKTVKVY